MQTTLHILQLMFTMGVKSYSSKKPQDADCLKPVCLFYLIVNHSVEWIIAFYKTRHCDKMSKFHLVSTVSCRYMVRIVNNQASRKFPSNSFSFMRQ